MSKSALIKSSLAKKYWMAGTGLFLCIFLIGHLAGNTLLLWPEHDIEPDRAGALAFNSYAAFMTTNPVIKILSYLTYFSILFHAIDGILLVIQNKKARPVNYAYNKPAENSSWASRNMGLLGAVLLFFIIVHMRSFWYEMHFGDMPYQYLEDGTKIKDLYLVTTSAFQNPLYTFFYVFCMGALSLHLKHGVESAIQTVGLKIKNYQKLFKYVAITIAFSIPAIFASIPIYLFFTNV